MSRSKAFQNKTVVITGASSGVGRAIALEFSKYRGRLVLAARNREALEEVAEECEVLGAKVLTVKTDVTQAGDLINLADAAQKFGHQIDVWVNNAGVLALGAFEDMSLELHHQVVKTNLLGYINGAHAVLPYFKRQGQGILINNISVGGYLPVPYGTAYSASKFGLRGFSEALRAELSGWKEIHICEIFPAFLDTPGMHHAANYTGKFIQPIPPLHDPVKLAKKIVAIALRPKASSAIHLTTRTYRLAYLLFPKATRFLSKKMIDGYLRQAEDLDKTDGNLFYSVNFGTGINGGWRQLQKNKLKKPAFAFSLILGLSLLTGLYLQNKK